VAALALFKVRMSERNSGAPESTSSLPQCNIPDGAVTSLMQQTRALITIHAGFRDESQQAVKYSDKLIFVGVVKQLAPRQADASRLYTRAKAFLEHVQENGIVLRDNTLRCALFLNASQSERAVLRKFGGPDSTLNAERGEREVLRGYNHIFILWAERVTSEAANKRVKQVTLATTRPLAAPTDALLAGFENFSRASKIRIDGGDADGVQQLSAIAPESMALLRARDAVRLLTRALGDIDDADDLAAALARANRVIASEHHRLANMRGAARHDET